ncbi:MAG: DUF2799 domain-containing protein [Desulfobulbaceae bacterium]|nr:DUF2799 domain-containing protein [Desulfobulbaceae bacterium]
MHLKHTAWIIISLLLSSGCATMNQSECLNADWRIIGMEDGAKGKLTSHIGRHRSACAKYSIAPDLETYLQGHKEGVTQYCTEHNGFLEGKSGSTYNGICPSQSEILFLKGYERGKANYLLKQDIKKLRNSISTNEVTIRELKDKSRSKEQQLIHQNISAQKRAELLRTIKRIERKRGRLQETIRDQKMHLNAKENSLNNMSHNY